MKLNLRYINCFWLLVPLLIWNIILSPKITNEKIISDANSPQWLLILENVSRIAVFIFPLFIPLQLEDRMSKAGLVIYIIGSLIYFSSWLPLIFTPHSGWSTSTAGLLAPRLTPLIPFLGIAIIGNLWSFAGLSLLFIFLHTWHGIQNL
jgi:hypothetical protein